MFTSSFPQDFIEAFTILMISEVGPHFDPSDPDTIAGKINTAANKKKCGYVNIASDAGGETKFGIAQNFTELKVSTLTLEQAMQECYDSYWVMNHCDKLEFPLSLIQLDGAYNHGASQQTKWLQRACSITPVDGNFGPKSMKMVTAQTKDLNSIKSVCYSILDQREKFFKMLSKKPGQDTFLKGWLNRVNMLRAVVLNPTV